MLTILVPSFNRINILLKNIEMICDQIKSNNLIDRIKIIISDNASVDGTSKIISDYIKNSVCNLELFVQHENIGLERNSIFLLKKATSEYIVFLGDDDFFPEGYLSFVITLISSCRFSAFIPGMTAQFADGSECQIRNKSFFIKEYKGGFVDILRLSHMGHQMSGVVLRREGLLETYSKFVRYHNIYPFVAFLALSLKVGPVFFVPGLSMLVSQGNVKDWEYDKSGLLREVWKNYRIVFFDCPAKYYLSCLVFSSLQYGRLGVGRGLNSHILAVKELIFDRDLDWFIKISLPIFYFFGYGHLTIKGLRFLFRYLIPNNHK